MNFPETFHEDTAEEEAEYAIRQMAQIMQPDSDMEWQTGHGPRQLWPPKPKEFFPPNNISMDTSAENSMPVLAKSNTMERTMAEAPPEVQLAQVMTAAQYK